jgi:hypothetical protein
MTWFGSTIWLTTALLACGFAIPAAAQPVAELTPTDTELRSVANEILSGDDFRHFEHFERSPSSSAKPDATTTDSTEEPAPTEESWWDRLRRQGATKTSTSSKSDRSSSDSTQRPKESRSENAPTSAKAAPSDASPVRPERDGSTTRPSQRGADGIERPVRFAPKSRTQTDTSSSDWGFGDSSFVSGLGAFIGSALHAIAYAVLIAVCVLILALAAPAIAEGWRGRARRDSGTGAAIVPLAHDRSPGETAADVFLQQALQLARQHAYREALGQLLLGAMSWIERKDWIRYRRGLTVRDYLRSVRSRPEQYGGLRVVVEAYEPVEFGRRPATQSMFESALAGYRAGFRGATDEH